MKKICLSLMLLSWQYVLGMDPNKFIEEKTREILLKQYPDNAAFINAAISNNPGDPDAIYNAVSNAVSESQAAAQALQEARTTCWTNIQTKLTDLVATENTAHQLFNNTNIPENNPLTETRDVDTFYATILGTMHTDAATYVLDTNEITTGGVTKDLDSEGYAALYFYNKINTNVGGALLNYDEAQQAYYAYLGRLYRLKGTELSAYIPDTGNTLLGYIQTEEGIVLAPYDVLNLANAIQLGHIKDWLADAANIPWVGFNNATFLSGTSPYSYEKIVSYYTLNNAALWDTGAKGS
ncbi:MAG: hypothetical protein ACTSXG_01975 [Alphaproteobacteria bacterium]